jgi:uncharacterized membrane protein
VSEPERGGGGLRTSPWNLLLLVPFLMLVTPWINYDQPRLFGMPFFYWIQFAFVPVGVVAVAIVYVKTLDRGPTAPGDPIDVDRLDEGTADEAAERGAAR